MKMQPSLDRALRHKEIVVLKRGRGGGRLKKLVRKFGTYNVAAFVIMGVGLILFLLTPLLIWSFDFDSDIIGLCVFIIGLLMWVVGFVVKKVRGETKTG